MMMAVKWQQLTQTLNWPVEVIEKATIAPSGYELMDYNDYIAYTNFHRNEYNAWADTFSTSLDNPAFAHTLRVFKLIHKQFNIDHPSKIDFRRHLAPEINLAKSTSMLSNGRPEKSVYSYQGEKIAEILFAFETNSLNFMTRRTEKLGYYNNADQVDEHYVIYDQHYDLSNPVDMRIVTQERSDARSTILAEIRGNINVVLAEKYLPLGWTYKDILNLAGEFWKKYGVNIDSWVNTGADNLKTDLLNDTQFEFLAYTTPQGQVIRDYIIQKISY
ncbi:MAG: hypothetical protein ACXVCY_04610 [Pseudobdellovibrionaceae bacterium]